MDEFELIRQYFAPLSHGFDGGLGLTDDAAILPSTPGFDHVITKDALSQGVHFIGDEPAAQIAQKALRVNLSDLAAMGATPIAYFLAIMLPKNTTAAWIADFAQGLNQDQTTYGIYLAGGDTISTQGPLSFSITAIGSVPTGKALRRNQAQPGDSIFVTGTLGDSALGLKLLQRSIDILLPKDAQHFLHQRYLLPEPRLAMGQALLGHANAAMDISDGLVQDLGHICRASGVGATIELARLPLSAAAHALIENNPSLYESVLTGGDDYELLFTVAEEHKLAIATLADELHMPISEIGIIEKEDGVRVLDTDLKSVVLNKKGFQHFS